MPFPSVTIADWRALVDKELAGKPFDKVLVHQALEGLPIAPLYTERPTPGPEGGRSDQGLPPPDAGGPPLAAADFQRRGRGGGAFRICMRHAVDVDVATLVADIAQGADAFWIPGGKIPEGARARAELKDTVFILDENVISTLRYHEAGADAADEIAIALSLGVRALESGTKPVAVQIAVGRDTFVELCKVRALRTCWQKLLAAAGGREMPPQVLVHAVCSSRTLTVRDPWVNMLRVTTQVFAAVLGGADLVTPAVFDAAFGAVSTALGHRVARNTGLVLREESFLGKVADAAGGSYYFETVTDTLAREAWSRFRELERDGGIVEVERSGRLAVQLEAKWKAQLKAIATRKVPILGVSEFANLRERLPHPSPPPGGEGAGTSRDAAVFEELRGRAEALSPPPEAVLVTLGTFAESRPRVGFAAGFFAAGGIATRESAQDESAAIVCLCGTDDAYAAEAAAHAKKLKAAGCSRVLLAGRPGALEASLRDAGVDGFIFVGCDAVAILSALLDGASS
ncbi:methylmalonyl-CoA mutase family protein [Pendulispora rubella]|uniref:Methylmalonyl-CoA mutase family protein n=1 Tax=Pendulispora rubella TaxID=2741070 RepID=A0ABZ2KRZ8_9BACT